MKNWIYLGLGILTAAFGLNGFLVPNEFIDGGVTGICMLISHITPLPLSISLVAINLPFLWLGYRFIGKSFAIQCSLAILALSLAVEFIPFPVVTHDKVLAAIFGGAFAGAGVGFAIRAGGVLDGTEILAVILSRRTAATVGEMILLLNVAIFAVSPPVLGIDPTLYSALTYFAASKTIDYLLHGIESYNSVTIVSPHHEEIRKVILDRMSRGVTAFQGRGGYSLTEQTILMCIVTRLEINQLNSLVTTIDPNAFMVVSPVHDVSGGVLKKRKFH